MKKRVWEDPIIMIEPFVANEYVAACGIFEDGTVLYTDGTIEIWDAYTRTPAGRDDWSGDDILSETPVKVYRGSFYKTRLPDGTLADPDSTQYGHEEERTLGPKTCVYNVDKEPWAYHYHFKEVTAKS